ncbi:MAG TPA: hypothetical protein VJO32_11060 [Ktedonobacteraceae bacterium]|nr:hypothetical protein [Ktedonobacteraceae bacterium]
MKDSFPGYKLTRRYQRFTHCSWPSIGLLLFILGSLTLLTSCSNPFAAPSQSGTVGADPILTTSPTKAVSPTPSFTPPAITLQVVGSCPSINWDSLVGTHPGVNKVQKVSCNGLTGNGSLDALVNVRYFTSDSRFDVYVYSNLSGTPTQLFKLQGLVDGDAQISPTNTLITAEIAPYGLPSATPDLFKEYQWNGSTFGQILFPGFFPDTSYYQALQDQASVNAGRDTWKTSGFPVLNSLALRLCHWSQTSDKTITYDSRTATYIVQVTNLGVGGGGFVAKLFRLDGVTTNIFEVMEVTPVDGATSLTLPAANAVLTNPQNVSGLAQGTSNILGHVVLFDETHVAIGDSGAIHSPAASGMVNFTFILHYQADAHGMQDGVLALFSTTQNNLDLSNQVMMIKVFISY